MIDELKLQRTMESKEKTLNERVRLSLVSEIIVMRMKRMKYGSTVEMSLNKNPMCYKVSLHTIMPSQMKWLSSERSSNSK